MATIVETGLGRVQVLLERVTDDSGLTYDQVTVNANSVMADGTTVRVVVGLEIDQSAMNAQQKGAANLLLTAATAHVKNRWNIP